MRFEIIQTTSGATLGVYEGATGDDAIRAMLWDAGTDGQADAGIVARPMGELRVEASNPRETSTGAATRGMLGTDVDVVVTMPDGRIVRGGITLLPREDGQPGVQAWGAPDNWISGDLLKLLRALPKGEFRPALDSIERAAVEVAVQS